MDENELDLDEQELTPKLHDRWTVLVLALDWAKCVAGITSDTLSIATQAAMQHGTQKQYDRKFGQITKEL